MGVMHFDAQPIPEVVVFIKKHYKGGTVIDIGCGSGRYTQYFPKDMYLGVDGYAQNITNAEKLYPDYKFEVRDLETWTPPGKKYDYLFSSVVLDQLGKLPKGWARNYILIEPSKYASEFNPQVSEQLMSTDTRMMVCN